MSAARTHVSNDQLELLSRLVAACGPSGQEEPVRQIVEPAAAPFARSVKTDALGNLLVHCGNPDGKRVLVAAHMDEIGIIVTHIDDQGFLRFAPLGGMSPQVLLGQRMQFANGTVGVVGIEHDENMKEPKLERMFVDIGAQSAAEAQEAVQLGDAATFAGGLSVAGDQLVGKALDDRLGCWVALQALQRLHAEAASLHHHVTFAFTVQEEVGLRGAGPAAYAMEPAVGLAIDVTPTGDTPKSRHLPVALGKGVAIKVIDRSLICHPGLRRLLIDTAVQNNIAHQHEVLPYGGTDAGPIHLSRGGVPSGVLSLPIRNLHTPGERARLSDAMAAVDLLVAVLKTPLAFAAA